MRVENCGPGEWTLGGAFREDHSEELLWKERPES